MEHPYNLNMREVEEGGSGAQGHPGVHIEFKTSLNYMTQGTGEMMETEKRRKETLRSTQDAVTIQDIQRQKTQNTGFT